MADPTGTNGQERFVATAETERGSKAPFYVVYATPDRETRWGFYCSNCESLDTAVDTMGRIQCNRCSNLRKPEGWDAAHE